MRGKKKNYRYIIGMFLMAFLLIGMAKGMDAKAVTGEKQVSPYITQSITADSRTVAYKSKPFKINAKASGGGKLSYKSNNKAVAEVSSSGKVKVKNYGETIITIKAAANGRYKATSKKITITVVPRAAKLKRVKHSKKDGLNLRLKKDLTVTGYVIQLSTTKDFSKGTYERNFKTNISTKGFKKQKYYVRVRAYKKIGNKKYYGFWSKKKKVRIR